MLGRSYVPELLLQPLERTWADAESAAGQILSRSTDAVHLTEMILENDRLGIEQGGRAIRRLIAVHLIRGMEWILHTRRTIAHGVEVAASDPLLAAGTSLLSQLGGELIVPASVRRERLRTEVRARFESVFADELPNWYAKALIHMDEQAMTFAFAPEGHEFVLGDTPAFTALTVDGIGRTGFGPDRAPLGPQTSVVMPLGPTICAVLSPQDSDPISDESAVRRLNELQTVRAVRVVVCTPDAPSDVVSRVKERVAGRWGYGADGLPNRPPDQDLPSVSAIETGTGQPAMLIPPA